MHLATIGNTKILRTPPPHISSSEERHTGHIVTPGFVDRPRWSDCTASHMDGEAGVPPARTSDSPLPTSKGHGSG